MKEYIHQILQECIAEKTKILIKNDYDKEYVNQIDKIIQSVLIYLEII